MTNNYGLIMAGGIGSRFWPISTPEHPKQFLDILGVGKSLLQLTFERLSRTILREQIFILTNMRYAQQVSDQLPDLPVENILCEPERKNTAPSLAYASAKIYTKNPNATLVVLPSDHLILNEHRFAELLEKAIQVAKTEKLLVTLGISPSRPDTGYGYIKFDQQHIGHFGKATEVRQFCEKPSLEMAKSFLDAGNYFWNAGIFVWQAETILSALREFQPALAALFLDDLSAYNSIEEKEFIGNAFRLCSDISIDYAVLEHAKNVSVVLSDFDWSDLGTWGSLNEHLSKDRFGNAVVGKNVFLFESENCLVNISPNKLVLLDGLKDYIIIESNNVFMVLKSENEQKLKEYLNSVTQADFFRNGQN
ncbi:MAG: mannose-1-phosphate guanylyltransferase [Bacteroidetes bacterium]|nr:mannose-1-phosphate guanylyltransferase [Bacteroidota bacterium]